MKFYLFFLITLPVTFSRKTYQFIFPKSDNYPHAELHGTIDHTLVDYTICHWAKKYENPAFGAIFSYENSTNSRILALFLGINGEYHFYHQGHLLSSVTQKSVLYWLHFCVTSSALQTSWNIYVNGVNSVSKPINTKTNIPIPPRGTFILGQDATPYSNKFNNLPFTGYIADVFLWDRILSPQEIAMVYACNYTGPAVANVINWNSHKWTLRNGVQASAIDLPCGKN